MDRYFDRYKFLERRKVRFAIMKLTNIAGQYWENVERQMVLRREDPVMTWDEMKERLKVKFLPLSFHQRMLGQRNRLTKGNESAAKYVAKFDEYLNLCSASGLETHIDFVSLSICVARFLSSGARCPGHTCIGFRLSMDLDESKGVLFFQTIEVRDTHGKSMLVGKSTSLCSGPSSSSSKLVASSSSIKSPPVAERGAVIEPFKVNPRTQCYRCQGYDHMVSQCPSQTKSLYIEGEHVDDEQEDVEEVVHQVEGDSDESVDEREFVRCIESIVPCHLVSPCEDPRSSVVRCTLTQP